MNLLLAFIRSCFSVFVVPSCCCALSDKQIKHLQNQSYTMSTLCNLNNCHKNKFHDNERWFYLLFLSRLCYCTQYKMCNGYNENMEYIFSYQVLLCIIPTSSTHWQICKECKGKKNQWKNLLPFGRMFCNQVEIQSLAKSHVLKKTILFCWMVCSFKQLHFSSTNENRFDKNCFLKLQYGSFEI